MFHVEHSSLPHLPVSDFFNIFNVATPTFGVLPAAASADDPTTRLINLSIAITTGGDVFNLDGGDPDPPPTDPVEFARWLIRRAYEQRVKDLTSLIPNDLGSIGQTNRAALLGTVSTQNPFSISPSTAPSDPALAILQAYSVGIQNFSQGRLDIFG